MDSKCGVQNMLSSIFGLNILQLAQVGTEPPLYIVHQPHILCLHSLSRLPSEDVHPGDSRSILLVHCIHLDSLVGQSCCSSTHPEPHSYIDTLVAHLGTLAPECSPGA